MSRSVCKANLHTGFIFVPQTEHSLLPKELLHPGFAQTCDFRQGPQRWRRLLTPQFAEQAQTILADLFHDRFLFVFGRGQAPFFNSAAVALKPFHRNPGREPVWIVLGHAVEGRAQHFAK